MKYFIGILFLLLFFPGKIHSQDVRFKYITKANGLSQSRVNAIIQDKDGFLWFGTDDGLNRYDGLKFTVFKNNVNRKITISDNWITCLFEDKNGVIWVGTSEGGLNKFNKINGTFTSYIPDQTNQSLTSFHVTSIVQKDDDHLWVGTNDGLCLFQISSGKCKTFKDEYISKSNSKVIPNDQIKTLLYDSKGILWIGTEKNGIITYDEKADKFESLSLDGIDDEFSGLNYINRVRVIFEDSKRRIWIGFQGAGIACKDRQSNTYKFYNSEAYNSPVSDVIEFITEDHNGTIWIATDNGISIYQDRTEKFKHIVKNSEDPFSLSDNHVRYIYEDKAQSIWCGTESSGISVYHHSLGKFNHVFNKASDDFAPLSNTIFSFAEGLDDDMWIATIGEGITRMNFRNNEIEHFDRSLNKTHDNILCFQKSNDVLWFGSWGGGIGKIDLKSNEFASPILIADGKGLSNNTVIGMINDEKENLWLATFNGLNYFDIEKDTIYAYTKAGGYPFGAVYSLYLDGNILWVGTKGDGLIRFNLKNKKTKIYKKESGKNESLSDNTIHAIFGIGDYLWLSTKNGLCKLNKNTGKCKNYYEADGLSGNFILGVLQDKQGNLWISTNNGITRFNPSETTKSRRYATRTYYAIDGLQSDEFNQNAFFSNSKGEMFFGGVNGFNHFYPEKIVDNAHVPPVFINSFKVFGKEFATDSSIFYTKYIELNFKQNFISFEFSALDYLLPEKNLYSYKMEGLDEYWSEPSTRNYISYSDLAGGDYVFMVRAANNDGVWNDTGIRIHIRVIPPFYKTKWFYALVSFGIILLVFIFIRLRISGIRREKELLEEKVTERTRELAEKNHDITSSIEYAKRIQLAILPDRKVIFEHFPDAFIYYQPKDIVSGDFYWFGVVDQKKIIAVVDCTGHGVPGAFMSMIGHSLLNQIILENKLTDPAKILTQLNERVKLALKQEYKIDDSRDGMDIALCVIDHESSELTFAGAFRPIYIIKKNALEKIEGDKMPIGGAYAEEVSFTNHIRKMNQGDSFFIHSDGIVDQFGGPKGKKFMGKQLISILIENSELSMQELKSLIIDKFTTWSGELEQVDDVLLIGIRIP